MAPIDLPQRMNLLYPSFLKCPSVQSLRLGTGTNIFLLFHAICHEVTLALAAPREVECAEGKRRF